MALTAYLCYSLQDGVTMIGYFNLWAAIFFSARFLQLDTPTFGADLVLMASYIIRVVYFFIMVNSETDANKNNYFTANKWTTFGIIAGAIAFVTLIWVEWAVVPTYSLICWVCIGGIESYHWFVIKDFAGITVGSFESYLSTDVAPLTGKKSLKQASHDETPMVVIL